MDNLCLSQELLKCWLEGHLEEPTRSSAAEHALGCSRCQAAITQLLVEISSSLAPDSRRTASYVHHREGLPEHLTMVGVSAEEELDFIVTNVDPESLSPVCDSDSPTTFDFQSKADRHVTATEGLGARIGAYYLIKELGRGGCGIVYLAKQLYPLQRTVAVKVLRPDMGSPEVFSRFEAERHALSVMDHPNISRVLDGGKTESGLVYFVMEFVDGMFITNYCDQHRLSILQRLELFGAVCMAVQHAHQKGIIHRDLKPSNVMVRERDGVPEVKVIDFGIAKAISQSVREINPITATGQVIGTRLYMSPEQIGLGTQDVDTRSDVYSLGVLLYQLLTSTTPFEARGLPKASLLDAMCILRDFDPPRPSEQWSFSRNDIGKIAEMRRTSPREAGLQIAGDLDWIVLKALERNPDRRYESVGAFAADLARYLNHELVEARPPSTAYKCRKFVRRHRYLLTLITAVVMTLLIGASLALSQAMRANTERTRAELAEHDQRQQTKRAEELLYAAQLRLANQHHQSGDDEQAEMLLSQWIPDPGSLDHRGLEWHLLKQNLLVPQKELLKLPGDVSSVRLSPDQTYLVTATNGGRIRRYDYVNAVELPSWETGLIDVRRMEFNPSGDCLAVISYEGAAIVLDTTTGAIQFRLQESSEQNSNPDLEFFDEQTMVTTGIGGWLCIWNIRTGELQSRRNLSDLAIRACSISRQSKRMALVFRGPHGRSDELHVYDGPGGNLVFHKTLRFSGLPISIAISHSGRYVAIGFATGEMQFWDLQTEQYKELTLTEQLQDMTFSTDDRLLAGAERSGVVHVWQLPSDSPKISAVTDTTLLSHFHWLAHARPARSVIFVNNAKQVISAGRDGRIVRWDWPQKVGRTVVKASSIGQMAWVEGRNALAILNQEEMAMIDRSTGQLLQEFPVPAGTTGRTLGVSPDGCHVAWSLHAGPIQLWNACSESAPEALPDSESPDVDSTPRFLRQTTQLIATTFRAPAIRNWDILERKRIFAWNFSPIEPSQFVIDGRTDQMYLLANDSLSRVNLETGQVVRKWAFAGNGASSVALTQNGDLMAIGYDDRVIELVSTADAQVRQRLVGHLGNVIQLQFTPDGKTLVALDLRGTMKFWQVSQGAEALTWPSRRHILAFTLSQDGRWLAVSHPDEIEIIEIPSAREL